MAASPIKYRLVPATYLHEDYHRPFSPITPFNPIRIDLRAQRLHDTSRLFDDNTKLRPVVNSSIEQSRAKTTIYQSSALRTSDKPKLVDPIMKQPSLTTGSRTKNTCCKTRCCRCDRTPSNHDCCCVCFSSQHDDSSTSNFDSVPMSSECCCCCCHCGSCDCTDCTCDGCDCDAGGDCRDAGECFLTVCSSVCELIPSE